MVVQNHISVTFSYVLDLLPDLVDRQMMMDYFVGCTDFAYGTNSHSLVPWSVLADDLTDCCIELGYGAPDINKLFPKMLMVAGNMISTDDVFVDLEN